MQNTKLSFCDIKAIAPHVCEVTVYHAVEIDDDMVDEYHGFLTKHQDETKGLLINKKNDYTYTFSAQTRLLDLPHVKAIAVVVYRQSSRIITELISRTPRRNPWNLKIFDDYDEAVDWLRSEVDN